MIKFMEKDYEIRRGRIEIDVPHEDGKITFVSPAKGPNNYVNVQNAITEEGLVAPTMAQTASLCYTANQNSDEPEFNEVLNRLDRNWLWGFNGVLYVPNKGAYIQDNPNVKDGRVVLDESELVKTLESGDKSVRFVPFGYKTGEQTVSDLAKNDFVIGLAGEQGTEKLAKLCKRYRNSPFVFSFDKVENNVARVSSLYGYGRLDVCGNGYDYDGFGYALGIAKEF